MKNKSEVSPYAGTRVRTSPQNVVTTDFYNGSQETFILSSSTNIQQNKGDRKTGTPYSFAYSKNPLMQASYNISNSANNRYRYSGTSTAPAFKVGSHVTAINFSDSNAQTKAIEKFYEKIRGDVDLSVDAFQIRQTLSMLRNPMGSISNLANLVRKKAKREKKEFSDLWLEYQYGWMPLISTAYGIAKLAGGSGGSGSQLIKAGAKSEDLFTGPIDHTLAGYTLSGNYKLQVKTTYTYYALISLSDMSAAQAAGQYTSLNPASIGWELLPYSFVVDWFVGIGSYLRTVESAALYGSVVKSYWYSRTQTIKQKTDLTRFVGSTYGGSGSGAHERTDFSFRRATAAGAPQPSRASYGTLSDQSWTRWGSALALLRNALR